LFSFACYASFLCSTLLPFCLLPLARFSSFLCSTLLLGYSLSQACNTLFFRFFFRVSDDLLYGIHQLLAFGWS